MRAKSTAGMATCCLFILVGCGSHAKTSDKLLNCRLQRENAYRAAIVERYYEQGKLGSEAQIIHEFNSRVTGDPGFGRTLFDDNGHLIPYGKLTLKQIGAFDHFMYQSQAVARTDVDEKVNEHLVAIDAPCGS